MNKALFLASASLLAMPTAIAANVINLSEPNWLGNYQLASEQLVAIKKTMIKAFDAPVDQELECGEVRQDCVVRAAREWDVDGNKYREIVIHLHTVGHASHTVYQEQGKWPEIKIE